MAKGNYTIEVDVTEATEALKAVRAIIEEILDGIDEATVKASALVDALEFIGKADE